jgi:hypothetical protein
VDDTLALDASPTARGAHRRALWVGVVCVILALVGVVAALAAPSSPAEVATAGRPMPARPPAIDGTEGTAPAAPDAIPLTTTTTTITAPHPERPSTAPTPAEFEAENGCIPGSYRTGPGYTQCTPYPRHLVGRVTDASGRPLSGVCITSGLPGGAAVRTGDDGRYTIADGLTGSFAYGSCPDSSASFRWVTVTRWLGDPLVPGETKTVPDVVLEQSGGVRGRVLDLDGRPVAGVCVNARTVDERVSQATDVTGAFSLIGVLPGTQPVSFRIGTVACPTVGIWDPTPDVVVRPGEWTEVTLRMQPGQQLGELAP